MSKKMIYHIADGSSVGEVAKVWGVEMLTLVVAESEPLNEGWYATPNEVLQEIEGKQLQAENQVMEGIITQKKLDEEMARLKVKNETLKAENERLQAELAVFTNASDKNDDGVVSIDEMNASQLKALLKQHKIAFKGNASLDTLRELASEIKT